MKLQVENVFTTVINATKKEIDTLYNLLSYNIPSADYIRMSKIEEAEEELNKAETIEEMRRIKRKLEYWNNWDGKSHLFDMKRMRFPSGLLYVVSALFNDIEIEGYFTLPEENERYKIEFKEKIKLEKYQKEAVEKVLEMDVRCILHAATGAGKTVMAIYLIKEIGVKTIIIVPNLTLMKQWEESLIRFLPLEKPKDKKKSYRILHYNEEPFVLVTTAKFLYNVLFDERESTAERNKEYRNFIEHSHMLIYDECHRASSSQSEAVLSNLNCYHRLGLTATPDMRTDKSDIVYHAYLGPNVANITRTRIVEEGRGIMPKIKFIRVPSKTYPRWKRYAEIYDDYIVNNKERNKIIIEKAKEMAKKGKVLVLVDRINHAKILGLMSECLYTYGDDKERFEKFEKWKYGDENILICTVQLVGEGFDFPKLHSIVLAGSWKSQTRTIQTIGRLMRKCHGKKSAEFIDFANNCDYLFEHTIKRAQYWIDDGFKISVKGTFLENYFKEIPELEEL